MFKWLLLLKIIWFDDEKFEIFYDGIDLICYDVVEIYCMITLRFLLSATFMLLCRVASTQHFLSFSVTSCLAHFDIFE